MSTELTSFNINIIKDKLAKRIDELDTLRGGLLPDDPWREQLNQQREDLRWRILELAKVNIDQNTPAFWEVARKLKLVIDVVKETIEDIEKVATTLLSLTRLITVVDDLLKLGSTISSPAFSPVMERATIRSAEKMPHRLDRSVVEHLMQAPPPEEDTVDGPPKSKPVAPIPVEEVLHGIELTDEKLIITVATGGCTKKSDFHIEVKPRYTYSSPYLVTVYRIKSDDCKGLFEPIRISFSRKKLGLEGSVDLHVLNRIGNTSQHRLLP